jgi:hypothetical protein
MMDELTDFDKENMRNALNKLYDNGDQIDTGRMVHSTPSPHDDGSCLAKACELRPYQKRAVDWFQKDWPGVVGVVTLDSATPIETSLDSENQEPEVSKQSPRDLVTISHLDHHRALMTIDSDVGAPVTINARLPGRATLRQAAILDSLMMSSLGDNAMRTANPFDKLSARTKPAKTQTHADQVALARAQLKREQKADKLRKINEK